MPPAATKSKSGKISKSHILTPSQPQGQEMSVKCEQPLDELMVQVWLLYDHSKLYILHFICKLDGITDGQTAGRSIRSPDAPGGPFRPEHSIQHLSYTV